MRPVSHNRVFGSIIALSLVVLLTVFAAQRARADRGGDPDAAAPAAVEAAPAAAEQAGQAEDTAGQPAAEATEATEDAEQEPVTDDQRRKGMGNWQLLVPIGLLLLLFVFMGRKPKKEQKKREEMLANLKKGDKVTSIGGIVGTIIEVRDAEVTVKVDESSNARMKFARWAIRSTGTPSDQQDDKSKS